MIVFSTFKLGVHEESQLCATGHFTPVFPLPFFDFLPVSSITLYLAYVSIFAEGQSKAIWPSVILARWVFSRVNYCAPAVLAVSDLGTLAVLGAIGLVQTWVLPAFSLHYQGGCGLVVVRLPWSPKLRPAH